MLFRLSDVTKTYGPITALSRLSVAAAPGAVGLLGPNGAGKTTLIRTLLGLITIDSGGNGGRAHSLDEWIDVERNASVKGIQLVMTTLVSLAGLQ